MKRTRLADRLLPNYSFGEELTNTLTHSLGILFGVAALAACLWMSIRNGNVYGIVTSAVYGLSLIALYTVSSVYHGLRPGMAKKIMQVIDHCTIYFLIAGTYTVVLLSGLRPVSPGLAWGVFGFEWALAAVAITLTAIDLKAYRVFSMSCYIGMGWAILPFAPAVCRALGRSGFALLLWGGIAYTIGAVLYGIGAKKKWMHSVFHVFVLLGSTLQFVSILRYAL